MISTENICLHPHLVCVSMMKIFLEKERERLTSDDRSRREKLLDDLMRAQQVYMDNLNFDDLNYNQDFMHELCVLFNV
jgi:hypothetical protein